MVEPVIRMLYAVDVRKGEIIPRSIPLGLF
jgi:hypothetical protein